MPCEDPESSAQFTQPEITPQEFALIYTRLKGENTASDGLSGPILVDVREPWEFQTARLPGSVLMPMGEVTARAHAELDPETHIVVLCHHGQRSLSVTMWLRNQGFEQAQSLSGGIDAWSRMIDASVPRYGG